MNLLACLALVLGTDREAQEALLRFKLAFRTADPGARAVAVSERVEAPEGDVQGREEGDVG